MNKFIKLTTALLLVLGGLTTVSAQKLLKLGTDPFTIDSSAALQIDSAEKGFLLPRISGTTSVANPATGLMIFNSDPAVNQPQVNIGTSTNPKWVGMTTTNAVTNQGISATKTADYPLVDADNTVLFNLTGGTGDVTVTLPEVTDKNAGKIYVINRMDNNSDRKLLLKPDGALVVSYPVANPPVAVELNYAKKLTIQANYVAGVAGVPAKGTWNVIGMN